jgi:hypothetical protein
LPSLVYQTAPACGAGRFWDYDAVWDDYPDLSRSALIIRTCIARHADRSGTWIASYGRLAHDGHMSRRQAIRAAHELRRAGLLSIERRTDRLGRQVENALRLLLPARVAAAAATEPTQDPDEAGAMMSPYGDTVAPIGNTSLSSEVTEQQHPQDPDPVVVSTCPTHSDCPTHSEPSGPTDRDLATPTPQPDLSRPDLSEVVATVARECGAEMPISLAHRLVSSYGLPAVEAKVAMLVEAVKRGTVRNPIGWLVSAAAGDWRSSPDAVRAREEALAAAAEAATIAEQTETQRIIEQSRAVDATEAALGPQERAELRREALRRIPQTLTQTWPPRRIEQLIRMYVRSIIAERLTDLGVGGGVVATRSCG